MAKIIVLSGDFPQGDGEYLHGTITLKTPLKPLMGKSFPISELKDLTVENTESNKDMKRAIGLGVLGALFLGPLGAIAGYLLAGRETEVTFLATLKDGRTLLAATDGDTYQEIATCFSNRPSMRNLIAS
ncbi:hypothetical protein ACQKQA_21645 [Pseudomonas sp. NPDC089530]|uniref:hypothetical protein n=1 Tax=Pseudomonas sp. NPDC089530 TaxID=3390651 RepID=UPI003CFEC815